MKTDVVTSDGTAYRVTFSERTYPCKYCYVKVRAKRKLFGWRTVSREDFRDGNGAYDDERPDFVKMARWAVMFYHTPRTIRANSFAQLRKWDGKVDI
jgi:hypothetical protein